MAYLDSRDTQQTDEVPPIVVPPEPARRGTPCARYREAKAFLNAFAQRFATTPYDHELLQGAVNLAARTNCILPKSERGVARNQILRHFEHKTRRTEGVTAEEAEALNVQLSQSLHAISYRFSLGADHAAGR